MIDENNTVTTDVNNTCQIDFRYYDYAPVKIKFEHVLTEDVKEICFNDDSMSEAQYLYSKLFEEDDEAEDVLLLKYPEISNAMRPAKSISDITLLVRKAFFKEVFNRIKKYIRCQFENGNLSNCDLRWYDFNLNEILQQVDNVTLTSYNCEIDDYADENGELTASINYIVYQIFYKMQNT